MPDLILNNTIYERKGTINVSFLKNQIEIENATIFSRTDLQLKTIVD